MTEQQINYLDLLEKFNNIKTGDCVKIISSKTENNTDKATCILSKSNIIVFKTIDEKKIKVKLNQEDLKNMGIEDIIDLNKLIDYAQVELSDTDSKLSILTSKETFISHELSTSDKQASSDELSTETQFKIDENIEIITKLADIDNNWVIGLETLIREKKDYERTFSYNLQKNSITEQLLNSNLYNNKFSIQELEFVLEKKAEKILDFSLRSKTNSSYKKPLIENFKSNDYSNFILKPIVKDVKKIHMENFNILTADKSDKNRYPDLYFSNCEDDIIALEQHSKEYYNGTYTKKEYDQNNNYLYQKSIQSHDLKDNYTEKYYYLNRPYFNEKPNVNEEEITNSISYYKTEKSLDTDQVIFRSCLEYPSSQRCNSLTVLKDIFLINKNNYLQSRIADGNTYILEDKLTNRIITDKKSKQSSIITCSGSGNTTELFFSTSKNKKDHKISDYNKSIINPPSRNINTEGEIINITGILIKSINDFQPQFTNTNLKNIESNITIESHGSDNITKFNQIKNIGYNLVDQININEININNFNTYAILNNYNVYQNINNANFIDYSKNNFIYFNTNPKNIEDIQISSKKLTYYLDKIIPNPIDIFKTIEPDNLKKCENFKQLDRVLSKYDLSIYNFNKKQINSINIKVLLQNSISKNYRYSKYLKLQKKYFKDITEKAISLFNLIIKNKKIIEKNDIYPSVLNNINNYSKELIIKIYEKIHENVKELYTYDDLLNINNDCLKNNYLIISDTQNNTIEYTNILYKIIEYIIVKYKYNIEFYNNLLYKNIINYKNNYSHEQKIILHKIFKIYNINNFDSLFLNNFTNKNNLSNNDLTIINLIFDLKKSYDNGKLIYEYMSYLNKLNNLHIINNQLLTLSIKNYKDTTHNEEAEWSQLEEHEKEKYKINLELIELKTKEYETMIYNFNQQKKILNFMHTKCENFEVVKVYKNKDHIINDNKLSDLYYDSVFDTTKSDIEDIKYLLGKSDYSNYIFSLEDDKIIKQKLTYKYIFNSDSEILKKIENIKENFNKEVKQQKRKILNGNFALLYTVSERILYKYIKGIWIPLNKQDIINDKNCTLKKEFLKYILNYDFDDLFTNKVEFIDEQEYEHDLEQIKSSDIDLDINSNISIYPNNISVPKKFLSYIYKASKLKSDILLLKNTLSSKNLLKQNIDNIKLYVDNEIKDRNSIIENKNNLITNITNNQKIDNTKKIPYKYWKLWKNTVNITDTDLRLEGIKNIIDTYGTLKKQESGSDNKIDEKSYYWDIPLTNEKMCCVHYYDLVDIAWKNNDTREKILENIKIKYCTKNISEQQKGGLIDNRYICNYCGETIDYIILSDFEGYVGEKPIKFREKNSEFNEIDNESEEFISYDDYEKQEILDILKEYSRTIGLNLNKEDIKLIVKNSDVTIKHFYITLNQYLEGYNTPKVFEFNEGTQFFREEKDKKAFDSYKKQFKVDIIKKEFIEEHAEDIDKWQQLVIKYSRDKGLKKPPKEYLPDMNEKVGLTNQEYDCIYLFSLLQKKIIPSYKSYLATLNLSIILHYLLNVIFYSIPKYNIKGTGNEKIAKIKFFGFNYNNPESSIDYLLKNITNNFIIKTQISDKEKEKDKYRLICWKSLKLIYNNKQAIDLSNINTYDKFKNLGWNYVESYIENTKVIEIIRTNFYEYEQNLKKTKLDIIQKETEWSEFKPTLTINYEFINDEPIKIEDLVKEYNDTEKKLFSTQHEKETVDLHTKKLSELKKNILSQSTKYSQELISLLNKKINQNEESKYISSSQSFISYFSNCCSYEIGNNYIDFFKSDSITYQQIQKLLTNIQNANKFFEHTNTSHDNIIQFTNYNLNSDGTNYRTLLDYMNIDENTTIFEKKLFPDPENHYLSYLKKQVETINLTIITEYTTNNINLFGKKRIWQNIKEYDVYIINDIYTEYAKKSSDSISELTDDILIPIIVSKLKEKYPLITNEKYIINRAEMINDVYNNSSTEEFGLVKLDKISNQYEFQIKNIISKKIQNKSIDELKEIIQKFNIESNTKNILNKNYNYITDYTRINNFYKNEFEYIEKIQNYINKLYKIDTNYTPKIKDYVNTYLQSNNKIAFKKNLLDLNYEYFGLEKIKKYVIDNNLIDEYEESFDLDNYFSSNIYNLIKTKYTKSNQQYIQDIFENMGLHEKIKENSVNFINNRLIIENYTLEETKKNELQFRKTQLNDKHHSLQIEIYNKYSRLIINLLRILYYQINKQFFDKIIGSNVHINLIDGTKKIGKIIGINSLEKNPSKIQTYNIITDDGTIYPSVPSSEDVQNEITYSKIYIDPSLKSDTPLIFSELLQKSRENLKQKTKKTKKTKNIRPINNNNKPWWMHEDFEKVNILKPCPTFINILGDKPLPDEEKKQKNLTEIYDYYENIDTIIKNLEEKKISDTEFFNNNIVEFMYKIQSYIERTEDIFNLLDLLVPKRNSNISNLDILETISLFGNTEIFLISQYIFYRLLIFIFIELENNDILNIIKLEISDIIFYKSIFNLEELFKISDEKINDLLTKEKSKKNKLTKEKHSSMDIEKQQVQQLMRAFNLGSKFGAWDNDINDIDHSDDFTEDMKTELQQFETPEEENQQEIESENIEDEIFGSKPSEENNYNHNIDGQHLFDSANDGNTDDYDDDI